MFLSSESESESLAFDESIVFVSCFCCVGLLVLFSLRQIRKTEQDKKEQAKNEGSSSFRGLISFFILFCTNIFRNSFVTTSPRNHNYRMRYLFYEKLSI